MTNDLGGCVPILADHLVSNLLQRKWVVTAALSIVVWDYCLSFGDEWGCIWRRPFSGVKALYVYVRYMPLAVQSVNLYLVMGPLFSNIPIEDPQPCFRWWLFLLLASSTLLECLDIVLLLRIYALYQKDKNIAIVLVGALAALVISQIIMGTLVITKLSFNCLCDSVNIYPPVLWLGVIVWIVQILIGALLLGKRGLRSLGSRVVKIVNRDGALIVGLVCAIFAFIIPYSTVVKTYQVHIIMIVPISLVSVASCRAILNLLTINPEEITPTDPEICMLTVISSFPTSTNTNSVTEDSSEPDSPTI
ncbi:hypothetical protein BJ165DRAFT_364666 [Panaeolus papilionaceus]|nr:hypothetical protein BJ165DRAFT_364666 [Panaeolus papilionaceus]